MYYRLRSNHNWLNLTGIGLILTGLGIGLGLGAAGCRATIITRIGVRGGGRGAGNLTRGGGRGAGSRIGFGLGRFIFNPLFFLII